MIRHNRYLKALGLAVALAICALGLAWAMDPALISGGQFGSAPLEVAK